MNATGLGVRAVSPSVDLSRLVAASQGVRAALLMGIDGEVHAKHGEAAEALANSISLGVGVVDLAQRLSEEAGTGLLNAHVMIAEAGTIVLHHVDPSTLVAILATPETPLGGLLHDIRYVTTPKREEATTWH